MSFLKSLFQARCAQAVVVLLSLGSLAQAGPITITVEPSIGPSQASSLNFSGYASNAITGLVNGQSTVGSPTSPTYYSQTTTVTANQLLSSDFNSWMGSASPTGNFANEFGNSLYFGVHINGNGSTFALDQLHYAYSSSLTSDPVEGTPGDPLAFSGQFPASYQYSYRLAGDGGTVTSGPATQTVSSLDYNGISNSFAVYSSDPASTFQGKLDAILADLQAVGPFSITGSYYLTDANGNVIASGSATVNVVASTTPEPASCVLIGIGMACLGAYRLRRRAARKESTQTV